MGRCIALDGNFYQIPTDGHPREIAPSERTPYATVTFFDMDQTFAVANISNYSQLRSEIGLMLPNDDAIYAIKVVGLFAYAETRSVPVADQALPTVWQMRWQIRPYSISTMSRAPPWASSSPKAWTGSTPSGIISTS